MITGYPSQPAPGKRLGLKFGQEPHFFRPLVHHDRLSFVQETQTGFLRGKRTDPRDHQDKARQCDEDCHSSARAPRRGKTIVPLFRSDKFITGWNGARLTRIRGCTET